MGNIRMYISQLLYGAALLLTFVPSNYVYDGTPRTGTNPLPHVSGLPNVPTSSKWRNTSKGMSLHK